MKALVVVLMSFFLSQSQAATYKSIKCSNSDGTVIWESGRSEDLIHLKYAHFVEGTLTLELDQVQIELEKEILVQEKSIKECTFAALSRVFASKVTITAADKNPYVLSSLFPENKVETEVICTFQMNTPRSCPSDKY